MKVYVDELPKSCEKCGFCEYFDKDAHGKGKHEVACYFNGSLGNILYGNQTSPQTCPLQSLAEHDKQVRKEVCEEIFRAFNRKIDDEFGDNDTKYITLDVEDVNFYLKDLVERIGEEK